MTIAEDSNVADKPEPVRHDPIRDRYFRALEQADWALDKVFYIASLLSFAVLVVDKYAYPRAFEVVEITLIVSGFSVFLLGLVVRLYLTPRGEDQRRLDLLTNTQHVPLTHETTTGYYNNDETEPIRRLGVAIFENSHFTRSITLDMVRVERVRVVVYAVILAATWLHRATDLEVAATAAQVVFSEQILSRYARLEWLRSRSNTVYDCLYTLFQHPPPRPTLHARVLQQFVYYETSKANAGITLSSRVFQKLNRQLSDEWDKIKVTLGL